MAKKGNSQPIKAKAVRQKVIRVRGTNYTVMWCRRCMAWEKPTVVSDLGRAALIGRVILHCNCREFPVSLMLG